MIHYPVGRHLLIELFGATGEPTEELLRGMAKDAKSHPLKYVQHKFKPVGTSAVIILQESHISIHTYPEFGYVAADIFTCGKTDPYAAIARLKAHFWPQYILINEVPRGVKQ